MTFNNEISVITISGLLGIINYWIFYQLDLFNFFNNKNSDEKGTLIVLLGLVNIVSFQLISNNTEFHIIFVIIISLILSIAVELFVLYSIKRISEFIISNYFKNVKSYKVFENSLASLFEENSDKELFVYIYDFNDKLIDYGYVDSYTYENNENNIILALSNDYEIFKETRDIEELDYDKVFIDFDRKIKIYPFIVGDSREEDIDKLQNNDREQYIREVEKEDLLRIHENVMFWIENCDNKTSIILGVVGIILTIFLTSDSLSNLVNNIEESITNMNWLNFIYLIAVLLTILFLAISITFLVKVLISNTNPETIDKKDIKTNSLLHFESINKIESNDEYIEKIKATDKDDYLRDLTSQIMINSHITTIKFRNYNIGVKFLAKTIILLFISVILSYTIF